jgi:IMP dehydrogenase
MIFIDTSDAHKPFSRDVIEEYAQIARKYKAMGRGIPPICGGNIVTADAFDYLVKAGADAVKTGMGPGSICTTNSALGVGAPAFWSLVEVANKRNDYFKETNKYIPIIADGGLEGIDDIAVAMTYADAIMGGKLFGCFYESAGDRLGRDGKMYKKGDIDETEIVAIRIYGEGSKEAMQTSGDLKRYVVPLPGQRVSTFQGISGLIKYMGRFKPGAEDYIRGLREALYHAGAHDLETYHKNAVLIRFSEEAKKTALPHGIEVIE